MSQLCVYDWSKNAEKAPFTRAHGRIGKCNHGNIFTATARFFIESFFSRVIAEHMPLAWIAVRARMHDYYTYTFFLSFSRGENLFIIDGGILERSTTLLFSSCFLTFNLFIQYSDGKQIRLKHTFRTSPKINCYIYSKMLAVVMCYCSRDSISNKYKNVDVL